MMACMLWERLLLLPLESVVLALVISLPFDADRRCLLFLPFIDECIELHDQKKLSNETASMSKYWGTDLENKVAAECLQLHGGWGFMWETSIARAYANARVQTIYGGSNEIMKELIARSIVKPTK